MKNKEVKISVGMIMSYKELWWMLIIRLFMDWKNRFNNWKIWLLRLLYIYKNHQDRMLPYRRCVRINKLKYKELLLKIKFFKKI